MFIGNKITIESVRELLQTIQYQTTLANQLNRVVGIGLLRLSLQVSVYSYLHRYPLDCLNSRHSFFFMEKFSYRPSVKLTV